MVFVHTHSCSIHRVTCDTATLLNLYLLLNAVRALNRFAPLHVDDFAITSLANSTACLRNSRSPPPPPPPPFGANGTAAPKTFMDALLGAKDLGAVQKLAVDTLQTGLHSISADIKTSVAEAAPQRADDLASIYRECRSTLTQAAGVATGALECGPAPSGWGVVGARSDGGVPNSPMGPAMAAGAGAAGACFVACAEPSAAGAATASAELMGGGARAATASTERAEAVPCPIGAGAV